MVWYSHRIDGPGRPLPLVHGDHAGPTAPLVTGDLGAGEARHLPGWGAVRRTLPGRSPDVLGQAVVGILCHADPLLHTVDTEGDHVQHAGHPETCNITFPPDQALLGTWKAQFWSQSL